MSLSTHTAPIMEPRRAPICQWANNAGARREMRAIQCFALRRWERSFLYFLLAHRARSRFSSHRRVKRRAIISPVVVDPAPDNWIEHPRQIVDRFVTALLQLPATKLVPDRLGCLVRHRRTEIE